MLAILIQHELYVVAAVFIFNIVIWAIAKDIPSPHPIRDHASKISLVGTFLGVLYAFSASIYKYNQATNEVSESIKKLFHTQGKNEIAVERMFELGVEPVMRAADGLMHGLVAVPIIFVVGLIAYYLLDHKFGSNAEMAVLVGRLTKASGGESSPPSASQKENLGRLEAALIKCIPHIIAQLWVKYPGIAEEIFNLEKENADNTTKPRAPRSTAGQSEQPTCLN